MTKTEDLLPGIDLAALKRLGAEYRRTTGLPLLLVDSEGRKVWSLGGCPVVRPVCGVSQAGKDLRRLPAKGR